MMINNQVFLSSNYVFLLAIELTRLQCVYRQNLLFFMVPEKLNIN
jgi:hypothetical protein